jgi:glycosyltransferase involved in cell wall biosynthesis
MEGVEPGHSKDLGLSPKELHAINAAHAERYRMAGMIFTISKRLSNSFEELYQVEPDRVQAAYAGPNLDVALIDRLLTQPKRTAAPTVLFIAKEVRRKGGDLVAQAFAQLRTRYPRARLLFAGTKSLPSEFQHLENVEHLGILDKAQPQQLQRLLDAFHQADVLVLPSRHDPFPTVIREAMFFGLPCIATNIWAMPEMIEDGMTGFLIPVDDAEALASRMIMLFENETLRIQMGHAARKRAESLFSWEAVGKVLSTGLQRCLASGASG